MAEVLRVRDVSLRRDERLILDRVDWTVHEDERWVVLGRNGCGKTTLIRIAALYLHPSSGSVTVLGETLGRTDVRRLRTRIALSSAALANSLRPSLEAVDVVMTAKYAALEPWWHEYDDEDRLRATMLLARYGCEQLAEHPFGSLSSGERQRVLLARVLMSDPGLVLLDEPTAGLDLGGREELVIALDSMAAEPGPPPVVLVTHHVEEIPPHFTHCLLLADGRVLGSGEIGDVLTDATVSECFGLGVELDRRDGRWTARAVADPGSRPIR
jgi:iron complex transport system ATP-binding protein